VSEFTNDKQENMIHLLPCHFHLNSHMFLLHSSCIQQHIVITQTISNVRLYHH